MRFGRSAKEAATRQSSGGDWIKYLKDNPVTFRILQDPDDWILFEEHFGNGGSYPCTNNRETCPGCQSLNEKEARPSRKMAFNVLESFNGQEYVNAYKFGPTVGDKLQHRYERYGTLTDRDYTISRFKTGADRWDFEIDAGEVRTIQPDISKYELKDIDAMLAQAWDNVWGDSKWAKLIEGGDEATSKPDEPPFEEKVFSEAELRKMDEEDLRKLIYRETGMTAPDVLTTSNKIVDWFVAVQKS